MRSLGGSGKVFGVVLAAVLLLGAAPPSPHGAYILRPARVFTAEDSTVHIGWVVVVEGEHRAAFFAQRERTDVALERPVFGLAALRIEPPDRRPAHAPARAVNPVEPAFLDVPDRAFAEMVGALEDAFDPHGRFSSPRRAAPRSG